MNKLYTLASVLLLTAVVSFADTAPCEPCNSDDDLTAEKGFLATADLLVVRPLGVAGSVAGFGIFAVISPFAAMADAIDQTYDVLVAKPGEYTFHRDLGDFGQ